MIKVQNTNMATITSLLILMYKSIIPLCSAQLIYFANGKGFRVSLLNMAEWWWHNLVLNYCCLNKTYLQRNPSGHPYQTRNVFANCKIGSHMAVARKGWWLPNQVTGQCHGCSACRVAKCLFWWCLPCGGCTSPLSGTLAGSSRCFCLFLPSSMLPKTITMYQVLQWTRFNSLTFLCKRIIKYLS